MGDVLAQALERFRGVPGKLVLAFVIDFTATMLKSNMLTKSSELYLILASVVVDRLPTTLKQNAFDNTPHGTPRTSVTPYPRLSSSASTSASPGLHVLPEIASIQPPAQPPAPIVKKYCHSRSNGSGTANPYAQEEFALAVQELLAFHCLQLTQIYLCHNFTDCIQRLHVNSDVCICHVVSRTMTRFPRNQLIQRFGADVLKIFAIKHIDLPRLGEYAPDALRVAAEACPHDTVLLRSFCTAVLEIARVGTQLSKDRLLKAGLHTVLSGILTGGCACEIAPMLLSAVTSMSSSPERSRLMTGCGVAAAVLLTLERHCCSSLSTQIQYEGLRALIALYDDSEEVEGQNPRVMSEEVKKWVRRIRFHLKTALREGSLGNEMDPLEVEEVVKRSSALDESVLEK
eukprot:gene6613-8460_t